MDLLFFFFLTLVTGCVGAGDLVVMVELIVK